MNAKWFEKIKKVVAGFLAIQMLAIYLIPTGVSAAVYVPTPTTPADGIVQNSRTVDYTWTDGSLDGATEYRIQRCNVDPGDIGASCANGAATHGGTVAVPISTNAYSFSYTTDLHYWWRVQAKIAGTWTTYGPANELFVDTSYSDTVVVEAPTASSWVRGNTNVKIDTSDNSTGVDYVEYFVGGNPIGRSNTPDASADYNLNWDTQLKNSGVNVYPDGPYTITATAHDRAGYSKTSGNRSVTVDNTNPTADAVPTGYANSAGTIYGAPVKIYYSDTNFLSATIDTVPTPSAASPITVAGAGLHNFTITDKSGNTVQRNFLIDFSAPNISDVTSTPVSGYFAADDEFSIHVRFDENVYLTLAGNMPRLYLSNGDFAVLDGDDTGSGTDTLNFDYVVKPGYDTADLDTVGAGALNLMGSSLTDQAANPVDITLPAGRLALNSDLVIDTVVPSDVTVVAPTTNAYVGGTRDISVVAHDNFGGSGIARVDYYIDSNPVGSSSVLSAGGTYDFAGDTTLLTDGQHNILAVAIDRADNELSSSSVYFYVDNTSATLTNLRSTGKYLGTDGKYYVNGTAAMSIYADVKDTGSSFDASSCYYTLDGGTNWIPAVFNGATNPKRCQITGIKLANLGFVDGDTTVKIGMKVVDVAGNVTETTEPNFLSPIVDSANPVVGSIGLTPASGIYTSSTSSVTAIFTDVASPLYSCEYRTKYMGLWSPWTAGNLLLNPADQRNGSCEAILTGLSDGGVYYFQMRARDTVRRTASTVTNFFRTVDGVVNSVDAGADLATNTAFSRTGLGTDTASGISSSYWDYTNADSGDGVVGFTDANDDTTDISATKDGVYNVVYTVVDKVGNYASDEFVLTWDTTGPTVIFVDPTPADDALSKESSQTISVEASNDTARCVLRSTSGGFENGLTNWVISGRTGIDTGVSHSGSSSLLLQTSNDYGSSTNTAYTTFSVPGSGTANFSAWIKRSTSDSVYFDQQRIYLADTSGNWLADLMPAMATNIGWTQVTYNLSAYAGQSVRVYFYVHDDGAGDPTKMWVDDVNDTGATFGPDVDMDFNGTNWYTDLSGLGTGTYSYNVMCTDQVGNTGRSETRSLVIDVTVPSASISYSTSAWTNGDVVATLDTYSEPISITNNEGSNQHTFTANGSFTFNFVDVAGNPGSATATVSNIDKVAPVIQAHENLTFEATSAAGSPVEYTSPNVTDNVTDDQQATCLPSTDAIFPLGVTTIQCSATDEVGNPAVSTSFNIEVVDTTLPTVTITGSDVTLEAGSPYAEPGATWSDVVDGMGVVTDIAGTVNTLVPGDYIVTYTYTDAASNAGNDIRKVTVEDKTAPVITITGGNVTITAGTVYTEPGATWSDIVDGIGNVTNITGTVNAAVVGDYTLTYVVTDVAGNTATSTRLVTVVAAPVGPLVLAPGFAAFAGEVLGATSEGDSATGDAVTPEGDIKGAMDTAPVDEDSTWSKFFNYQVLGLKTQSWLMIFALVLGAWWLVSYSRKKKI